MSENMSENKSAEETKTLGLSRPGRLELKKTVESGQVRQSFSHGRSKTVQVEVKKKRTFKPGGAGGMTEIKVEPEFTPAVAEVFAAPIHGARAQIGRAS